MFHFQVAPRRLTSTQLAKNAALITSLSLYYVIQFCFLGGRTTLCRDNANWRQDDIVRRQRDGAASAHAPSRGPRRSLSSIDFLSRGSRERDTGRRLGSGSGFPVTLSPVDIRVARARSAARSGGSSERVTRRRLGSGSAQPQPDSEERRENPEPGKRGLGGQPVTPPGRAPGLAHRPRRSGEQSALPRSG